jgi:hypothetical protein
MHFDQCALIGPLCVGAPLPINRRHTAFENPRRKKKPRPKPGLLNQSEPVVRVVHAPPVTNCLP